MLKMNVYIITSFDAYSHLHQIESVYDNKVSAENQCQKLLLAEKLRFQEFADDIQDHHFTIKRNNNVMYFEGSDYSVKIEEHPLVKNTITKSAHKR
jgi:hypothetical protein